MDIPLLDVNAARRSTTPDLKSPIAHRRTDEGYANLHVRVLKAPEENTMKLLMWKGTLASRGVDILDDEKLDEVVVEDAWKGGLNQCREWDTVVFEISGVSRGVTHELVRTRKASFAQQTMRATDMGWFDLRMPQGIQERQDEVGAVDAAEYPLLTRSLGGVILEGGQLPLETATVGEVWRLSTELSREAYNWLCSLDIPFQDARTVAPIATETYIVAAYPLVEFMNTFAYRGCYMFYPEIVVLFHRMRAALLEKAPWLEPHIKIGCETTAPTGEHEHRCTYQGWENVEGQCPLAWAKESNRIWKSRRFQA